MRTPTQRLWLIAGLTVTATASHALRIMAGNAAVETLEIQLLVVCLAYLFSCVLGLAFGLFLLGLERVSGWRRLSQVAVTALLAANLLQLGVAYGIGGDLFGFALAEVGASELSMQASLLLVLAAACAAVRLVLVRGGARLIELLAVILVVSTVATDGIDALSLYCARQPPKLQLPTPELSAAHRPSVVHLILDEMSGQMMTDHPELRSAAFFARAPSGIHYRAAYTNSIWTSQAIPQLLSGEFERPTEVRHLLFDRVREAGYALRLYLAAGPLGCSEVGAASCYSPRWAWQEVVFAGDWPSYAAHQLHILRHLYIRRFLGVHALRVEKPMWALRKELQVNQESPSRVLFDAFLKDLRSNNAPSYFFVHLLIPHRPLVHDRDCEILPEPSEVGPLTVSAADPKYLAQMHCANKLAGRLIDELIALERYDSTFLIVQSDHGPRQDLTDLMEREGYEQHEFSPTEAEVVEQSARILLWLKPPGKRRSQEVGDVVQITDVAGIVLDGLGLPRDQTDSEGPGDIKVLGLESHGTKRPLTLVRDRSSLRWRSVLTDTGAER